MRYKVAAGLVIFPLLSACAPALSVRMQPIQHAEELMPDPASATVVFLRPGGGGANAILDENGHALGEMPTPSKLVLKVSPGVHTFVKAIYKDPSKGDFSIFAPGEIGCHAVSGNFESSKIYFIEASVFRLFKVTLSDRRLAKWAALPTYQMDPAQAANASAASDAGWATCLEAARKNLKGYEDQKSAITPEDGVVKWPL